MVPTRVLRLLLVALSVSSTAQALQPMRIGVPMNALSKREPLPQATDDNNTAQATDSPTSDDASPTEDSSTPTASPTDEPETTPSDPPTTPTDQPTENPTTPTNNNTPTQTPSDTTDRTTPTNTQTENPKPTDTTEEPTTMTYTSFKTITRDNGEVETQTEVTTSTGVPSLSGDGSETSGMSTGTRNTIIGVVVGVGGAIVLCAVGFAAWRIRSRRAKAEENDGLIGYGGYTAGAAEKPDSLTGAGSGSVGGRSPFQSTLESYHAPTQVNQASNF